MSRLKLHYLAAAVAVLAAITADAVRPRMRATLGVLLGAALLQFSVLSFAREILLQGKVRSTWAYQMDEKTEQRQCRRLEREADDDADRQAKEENLWGKGLYDDITYGECACTYMKPSICFRSWYLYKK